MSEIVKFIGVGAVKSGSSWMASILEQHSEVSMSSRKEIAYFNTFNFNGTKNSSTDYGLDYYLKFWSKMNGVKGEISPQYLFDFSAPQKIKNAFPEVQILMILRNPKDVLYSHFLYEQGFNQNIEPQLSFIEALYKYPYLIESARFSTQVKRYKEVFSPSNLHIYFLDNALKDPYTFSKSLYSDIGLKDVEFKPDYSSVNESKKVDSKFVNAIIRFPSIIKQRLESSVFGVIVNRLKASKLFIYIVKYRNTLLDRNIRPLIKPQLTEEEVNLVSTLLRDEIIELENLLDLDLSRWKTCD